VRKIDVNIIIVFVVLASIALIIIQAYQTKQLFARQNDHFRDRVQTTLERIAVRHEKAEDVRKFFKIANTTFNGDYKDILQEEFQNLLNVKETISVKDTVIWENGRQQNYIVVQGQSIDTLVGVTTEQRVLARNIQQLRDFYHNNSKNAQDSSGVTIHLDRKIVKKLFERSKFINEMMTQAFRENVFETPESSFDMTFLDSVIRTEFLDENLPDNFSFLVTNLNGEPIQPNKELKHYNKNLTIEGSFATYLFPSNFFNDHLMLNVSFLHQNSFLLKELWLPLLVNLLLVLLIFCALIYMFKTILTQKKLSEIKSNFISNMTHEFRTPISTISLACQAMNDTDMLNEELRTQTQPFVKIIADENSRLASLVDGILQSNTIEKGEVQLHRERVLVNEVVAEVLQWAKFKVEKLGGKIVVQTPPDLVYIQADKMHFTNMISNLIDNAIKYSKEKPIIIVSLQQKTDNILIIVQDQGIGIKKEHVGKIFDNLYRIPTGNLHDVKGFGLGLSYVKGICQMHGWKINVQSKFGDGTTFVIEIKTNNK